MESRRNINTCKRKEERDINTHTHKQEEISICVCVNMLKLSGRYILANPIHFLGVPSRHMWMEGLANIENSHPPETGTGRPLAGEASQ